MNAIDTSGEVIQETVTPKPRVSFSLEDCYEWFKDPANEATIRSWAKRFDEGLKAGVQTIDKTVSEVGGLWRDILQNKNVRDEFVDSLIESVGFEKED
jgi:hypothetical protein